MKKQSTTALWRALVLILMGLPGHSRAETDYFSTGPGQGAPDQLCDVWQTILNGWRLDPAGDNDKDGSSNFIEAVAGTDPRKAGDSPFVKKTVNSASGTVFTFEAKAGKIYRMLSGELPAGPFATVVTQLAPVNGQTEYLATSDDKKQTITVARVVGRTLYYRLEVKDADSDNDGVSDWAEFQTGTDPRNPTTPTNASAGAASDGATLRSLLALAAEDGHILHLLKHGKAGAHLPEKSKLYKKILVHLAKEGQLPSSSSGISRGDFNGDGFADLAIGIPGEDQGGEASSGAAVVIYGSRDGLVSSAAVAQGVPAPQFWSQDSSGISGSNESGDRFGSALASGEFNGDDYSDLAIGVPGEDITFGGSAKANTGRVVIIYGSPAGLAASGSNMVRAPQSFDLLNGNPQMTLSVEYVVPENANLGQALAWGDFDGDGFGDLAIGAPKLTVKHNEFLHFFAETESGGVWVLYGSANGIQLSRDQFFTPDGTVGHRDGDEFTSIDADTTGYHFGAALTAGDFDANGADDLAIGIPDENIYTNVSGTMARRAGGVMVFPGSVEDFGVTPGLFGQPAHFCQRTSISSYRTTTFQTVPLSDERFGAALTAADFDGDGASDLVIGVPGQSGQEIRLPDGAIIRANPEAGAVHVAYGRRRDSFIFNDSVVLFFDTTIGSYVQFLNQDVLFGSGSETGDRFGSALAAGRFDSVGIALAIGVPKEDLAGGADAGEVNVIYSGFGGLSPTARRRPQRLGDTSAQAGARFGSSLSAWDFGRAGPFSGFRLCADLAVGAPFKDISGKIDAGAMHVFYGTSNGLTFTGEQDWTQDSPGIPGGSEAGDMFGAAGY
jgi:FG-GAP repeat